MKILLANPNRDCTIVIHGGLRDNQHIRKDIERLNGEEKSAYRTALTMGLCGALHIPLSLYFAKGAKEKCEEACGKAIETSAPAHTNTSVPPVHKHEMGVAATWGLEAVIATAAAVTAIKVAFKKISERNDYIRKIEELNDLICINKLSKIAANNANMRPPSHDEDNSDVPIAELTDFRGVFPATPANLPKRHVS